VTQLSADQAKYVHALWAEMRAAVHQFRAFDAKWNRKNDELTDLHERQNLDIVQSAKDKSVNLTLQGYMDGAKWFRDKAAALAAVIQAEQAAMEMLKGGTPWESPRPFSLLPESRGSSASPSV
jgi:hypothetical protein